MFDSLEVQIILQIITIPDAEEGFFSPDFQFLGEISGVNQDCKLVI